jgi:predicted DNA-binding protein (UPF0251 family)
MVRPRKVKIVDFEPGITYFKPRAVPLNELEEIDLTIDELEAMRLSNIEKIGQEDAALKMGIHQSTFQRILSRAREKVTDALVNGKAIKIHGGNYKIPEKNVSFPKMDYMLEENTKTHVKFSRGHGGICICPNCSNEQSHIQGQPCIQTKCEKCGSFMTRKI